MENNLFNQNKKELLRWLWLSADFLIIWLTVYCGSENRDIVFIPVLMSFLYFSIWHNWKDVFLKTAIFFLVNILTYDRQIMTIEDIFSNQMLQLISSKKAFGLIVLYFIAMLINYTISIAIIKLKKKLFGNSKK